MIRGLNFGIKKLILSLLFGGFACIVFSQTKIGGTINKYGHVTSLGADYVIVEDAVQFAQFAPGDTVLLMQMKGARIYSTDASSYGTPENLYGNPGKHEFLLISSVNSGAKKITFQNDIVNAFVVDGALQIVKVPSFNSAVVDNSDLTCAPWDSISKTGGILTMIIGRTLSLNKNIDVTGKGFTGGTVSIGTGLCVGSDIVNLDKYSYNSVFTNSGFKGESQVTRGWLALNDYPPIFPGFAMGKGANLTGGGGGNGRFSGGGGGSNYGAGGKGGLENSDCSPSYTRSQGGLGGIQLKLTALDGGIFPGGGGGSSTYLSGSTPSPGGNGGGIIIIVCDTIKGKGNSIIANGSTTTQASSNAGSGGGGGGGSIALYLSSFSTSDITISANGGKGGNNAGIFGEGGGGGGGLINISNISIPANVTKTVSFGGHGTRSGGFSAGDGAAGENITNFVAVLNGFLFNSIRSSVTGDQVDSVCSNMIPPKITGTKPVGGTLPYTYLWEKSYDQITWIPLVSDTDPTNYTPAVIETATVWFRRTITDSSTPLVLVDVSKSVKIIVQPFIKNNIVGTSDTICFAQDPPAFTSKATLSDGTGIYNFKWQVSTDNSLFNLPSNTYNTEGYTPPPALNTTSWYRRTVTSGRCVDSTAIVKITVLDTISNNKILSLPQDICFGMTFSDLTSTTPSTTPVLAGGDNTYWFRWESNINGAGWGTAPGVSNGTVYNPIELPQRAPMNEYYFRRIVYSGMNDVCISTSTPVLLRDYPVITNNNITANQTICSGFSPAKLIGSVPLNGNGIFTYSWQDSTKAHTWTDISDSTGSDYQPPALTDTTGYRRIVFSSACSNTSKSIIVNVHKPITNNSISLLAGGLTDTTICYGGLPHLLKGTIPSGGTNIPGDYAYQWKYSTDNVTWTSVPVAGTGVNFQSAALQTTTYYKREVLSGTCTLISSTTITLTVLPSIANNLISANQIICSASVPLLLTGEILSGGAGAGTYSFLWEQSADGGTTWTSATGTNNLSSGNYQPPALTVGMEYKRLVKSGANDCCTSISNVINISIHPLTSSQINAGSDTTLFSFDYIFHLVASRPFNYETAIWTLVSGSGDFDNDTLYNTIVRNLSKGINTYKWTIENGPCQMEDMVNINVLDVAVPEGFSPNNDTWNNTFIISGLDTENQYSEMKIINSAGTEVYSTSNINGGTWKNWDGKNSKGIDLPEGTYYYLLKLTSKDNDQVFKKSGFIVLKRY
jgi:gliding motility-associated-like protein